MLSNIEDTLFSGFDHGSNGSEHKQSNISPSNRRAIMTDEMVVRKEQPPQQQQMHRPSSQMDKSMKMKRESITISGMQYDTTLPHNLLDTKTAKRSYGDATNQIDANNFPYREAKLRKTEPMSPSYGLNDLKTIAAGGGKAFGASSLNGIETNPDLVSSLLKESLADTKPVALDRKKMPSHGVQDPNSIANFNMQQQIYDQQVQSMPKIEPIDSLLNASADRSQRMNQYGSQHHSHGQHSKHHQHKQIKDMEQMQPYNKIKQENAIYPAPSQLQQQLQQPSQLPMQSVQPHLYPQQQQLLPHMQPLNSSPELSYGEQDKHHDKKKKKKEKHKNKDKEKSKSREERKKHKKDKERSKDKSKPYNFLPSDGKPDLQNSSMQRGQATEPVGYVF